MTEKIDVNAINDGKLKELLCKLNLCAEIDANNLHCIICNKYINYKNIGGLKVIAGRVVIFCDSPECIDTTIKKEYNHER